MNGAIFFASKYGSTAQYAAWISEATGLPVFDVKNTTADPSTYDYLILASPVLYFRLFIGKWVRRNLTKIETKPIIMVTVSGAPAGPKLTAWIGKSLPEDFVSRMRHFALRGRQKPKDLTWYDWIMMRIGAKMNPDPGARKEELGGFDFMDKPSIDPIVAQVRKLESAGAALSSFADLTE